MCLTQGYQFHAYPTSAKADAKLRENALTTLSTGYVSKLSNQKRETKKQHPLSCCTDMVGLTAAAVVLNLTYLLHTSGNSGVFFYRTWAGLSKHFTTIYVLDWLGFGASSRPKFWPNSRVETERFFVESLESWRYSMCINQMVLVGHSMGGYLSAAYCEKYPCRVHSGSLFLMSPVGITRETKEILKERRDAKQSSATSFVWHTAVENLMPLVTFGSLLRCMPRKIANLWFVPGYADRFTATIDDPKERMAIAETFYLAALMPGSGEYCLCKLLNSFLYAKRPMEDRISKMLDGGILQRCFFYYGDQDWMDTRGGIAVHDGCQQSTAVCTVRNSGHMIILDNPQEFTDNLVRCL